MLRFLPDKDLFSEMHRRMLCRRLLMHQADEASERGLIEQLKVRNFAMECSAHASQEVCGVAWTRQLEIMLGDAAKSATVTTAFQQARVYRSLPCEMSVMVCWLA